MEVMEESPVGQVRMQVPGETGKVMLPRTNICSGLSADIGLATRKMGPL